MTEELKKAERHMMALETFMASPAYEGYLAAITEEIRVTEERILMLPPIDEKDRALCLLAHGELDCLKEDKTRFEVACTTLKHRISEMTELDNQSASERKI